MFEEMNRKQAKTIARLYLAQIAYQDDSFYVPGLSESDNEKVVQEVIMLSQKLSKGENIPTTQAGIVSLVLGKRYEDDPGRHGVF